MSEENGYPKWVARAAGVAYKSANVTTVSAPTEFSGVHLDQPAHIAPSETTVLCGSCRVLWEFLIFDSNYSGLLLLSYYSSVNIKGQHLTQPQRQGIFRFIISFLERRHDGDYIAFVQKKSQGYNIAFHCCSGTRKCQFHFFLNKIQQVLIWGQYDTSCIKDSSFSTAIPIRWRTKK